MWPYLYVVVSGTVEASLEAEGREVQADDHVVGHDDLPRAVEVSLVLAISVHVHRTQQARCGIQRAPAAR